MSNNTNPTSKRGLHIAHLNCQSICNKLDYVKLQIKLSGFDIFTLSETWLTQNYPEELLDIPLYDMIRQDRNWEGCRENKRGGGVALYLKQGIKYSTAELQKFNFSSQNMEILWVTIKNDNQRKIIIGTLYRPPQGNVKEFVEALTVVVNDIVDGTKADIFILGDFNINYQESNTPDKKNLKNFESLTGLKQLIDKPTRYAVNNSTIDLILTNSSFVTASGVLELNCSDHEAIYVTRKKPKESYNTIKTEGRSYRTYDKEKFQDNLKNSKWEALEGVLDVDEMWEIMERMIRDNIDKMCPRRC